MRIAAAADTTREAAFTYDALGRRIEHVNDVLSTTTRYFYDGVNEIVETDDSGDRLCYYVHGISYVDERLMMLDYKDTSASTDDRPYYHAIDRMYNVRFLVDRAGALVERYMYDAYGRPPIRESCGRGDMNNETTLTSTDSTRFTDAKNGTIWDPRADMDDDGDVDANDQTAYDTKVGIWPPPTFGALTVKQAFSDVGNPFMFQGRVHFALDTGASATVGKLMINDHRARKRTIGSDGWDTRDPLLYNSLALRPRCPAAQHLLPWYPTSPNNIWTMKVPLYDYEQETPTGYLDPIGLKPNCCEQQLPGGGCCESYDEIDVIDDPSARVVGSRPDPNFPNNCLCTYEICVFCFRMCLCHDPVVEVSCLFDNCHPTTFEAPVGSGGLPCSTACATFTPQQGWFPEWASDWVETACPWE